MPNQTVKNGLKAKKVKLPQMNLSLKKQLIKFSCTYLSHSFCKILQKFLETINSYEDVPFSGPKWPICPEQIFFGHKTSLLLSSNYWPFTLWKIWKILTADSELWGCNILGPKMVGLPWTIFFLKIINIILIYLLAPFIEQNF